MRQQNFTKALLIGFLSCGLMACEAEQTEKDIIAEAQFCLNKARGPAAVDSCMAPLQGLTSFYAYELKCAAGFVKADITSPENLSKALTAISDSSSSPTVMLAALTFPPLDSRGKSLSISDTFSDCNKSGRPGLKLIGAMAQSATALSSFGGGSCNSGDLTDCSGVIEDNINTFIDNLTSTDSDIQEQAEKNLVEVLGSIQTVYQTTCSGSYNANSDICDQINLAATQAGGIDFTSNDPKEMAKWGLELLRQWEKK